MLNQLSLKNHPLLQNKQIYLQCLSMLNQLSLWQHHINLKMILVNIHMAILMRIPIRMNKELLMASFEDLTVMQMPMASYKLSITSQMLQDLELVLQIYQKLQLLQSFLNQKSNQLMSWMPEKAKVRSKLPLWCLLSHLIIMLLIMLMLQLILMLQLQLLCHQIHLHNSMHRQECFLENYQENFQKFISF